MSLDMSRWWEAAIVRRPGRAIRLRLIRVARHFFSRYRFNSIWRRIIVVNMIGVGVLVLGILYLNQHRWKFVEIRVENLTSQAQIIASAIAQMSKTSPEAAPPDENKIIMQSGLVNPELSFRIDPEVVSPILRNLVGPTKTWARVFDADGTLISDSRQLYRGGAGRLDEEPAGDVASLVTSVSSYFYSLFTSSLPVYKYLGVEGKAYDEVRVALAGSVAPLIRVKDTGETVIQIGAPIRLDSQTVLGALLLTAQGKDIDEMVWRDRIQIVEVAALVAIVTSILSLLLAGTIAEPMRRLAIAAERVRKNIKNREQIPDFGERTDEIAHLSRAFRDMTYALYSRLDAIESFAADVAHELKNPLTSLRSAASLLPSIKADDDRKKLVDIINHDVRRLDRLITDISDASRLDAELARETARPVNMASLLYALCEVMRESRRGAGFDIVLTVQGCHKAHDAELSRDYIVNGHDSRLSQVIANLLENAISFSPKNGTIYVTAIPLPKSGEIEIGVEDQGPGIKDEHLGKIFERFYTDRPGAFGQNSGLGLNISQQIVTAHGGTIWAENRTSPEAPKLARRDGIAHRPEAVPVPAGEEAFACGARERHSWGARFVVRLPACMAH
jgi:two-component system, OmpR family, sensor histidine kinase ChvG